MPKLNNVPNFSTAVDIVPTDQGEAIGTKTIPNFATSQDVIEEMPVPKEERPSMISRVAQWIYGESLLGRAEKQLYLIENIERVKKTDDFLEYSKSVGDIIGEYEEEQARGGIGKVLETPMTVGVGAAAVSNPIGTAIGLAGFAGLDKLFNLRRYVDEKFPNTAPEIKDIAEITDFMVKGGLVGGGMLKGKKLLKSINAPKNTNISTETTNRIFKSQNLTGVEKANIKKTLKITDNQIKASQKSGKPINVKTEDIISLGEKPYWEMTKAEIQGVQVPPYESIGIGPKEIKASIKSMQQEKGLSSSGTLMKELKKELDIENINKATVEQLGKLEKFMGDLKQGDKALSPKQVQDLKGIFKNVKQPKITPKKILIEKFGEKTDILDTPVMSKIDPKLVPTVDIKQGHPLIRKIVDGAKDKLVAAEREVSRRNQKLDKMLTSAEKSRNKLLDPKEKFKRKLIPQNKEIFQALSGDKVKLTPEEGAVVKYLQNFFNKAKKDLSLQKYRKNYVTHLEKSYFEKILNDGVFEATKSMLKSRKKGDLPVDVMLELENIIGSEKFFRFAMERKGGVDPTTNLRRVINTYSNMYEMKKALDVILPEGQAITKNLLTGKSAAWTQQFLQNLKGRGLDNKFRTGPMGWLANTADTIIDIGYIKLLGLNWKSGLKNIVAGETNSWIYQDFPTWMKGKKRFSQNPNKAYNMAKEYGILEGTFAEYAQKGIGKLKKAQDASMVFQRAGEFEIRSSMFASMLSESEWNSGKISPRKITRINDMVAKTQGMFSKVDSPLFVQTWYGRMYMQMNRWRITNASLLGDITKSAYQDVKAGKYKTKNVSRFGKMVFAYGIGMYMSYEFKKAGFKTAAKVAESMAQTIDGTLSLFTRGELIKMVTENPSLQFMKEFSNTIQDTAKYLNVPGAEKARGKGVEETYIAPVENIEDLMSILEE